VAILFWLAMRSGPSVPAVFPSALVALPDGGLLYGELRTGRIRWVNGSGRLIGAPVARVPVSTNGQRGLLGLAVDASGGIYAAWTRPDGRITVGRVRPGALRTVWEGPPSAQIANGGRLTFSPHGALVTGIGETEHPWAGPDLDGAIFELDPQGPPDQTPRVVSTGWHNPFAMAFTPGGDLWVADNAPGEREERLTRGDLQNAPVTVLPPHTVPSGLAALSERDLVVCGYRSRTLQRYRISLTGPAEPVGSPLARDCALGVVVLADGGLAYATEDAIRFTAPDL
jgi:hypothetical protein